MGTVVGTVVGTLRTSGPDAGNTFTYSLVNEIGSNHNALFAIAGNQLRFQTAPAENEPAGSVIGNLAAIDRDSDNTFTDQLVAGTGDKANSAFAIVNLAPDTSTSR